MKSVSERPRLLLIDDGEHYADIIIKALEYEPQSSLKTGSEPMTDSKLLDISSSVRQRRSCATRHAIDVSAERLLPLPEAAYDANAVIRRGLRELKTRFPNCPGCPDIACRPVRW